MARAGSLWHVAGARRDRIRRLAETELPTICIVADRFDKPSVTFVRRHVRELNGGNTVTMAKSAAGAQVDGRPSLVWTNRSHWRRALGRMDRRPLLPGMPPDPMQARFAQFARANGVGAMLCEFGTAGVETYELGLDAGLPTFCYFRGFDASGALTDPRYRRKVARMFRHIDGVFAVSRFLLDGLAEHGLVHPNAQVVPSGVDTRLFSPEPKDPNLILAVGRMIDKKSPLTTIRAFARAAARHPALRLEMIGYGELEGAAKAEAAALGLAERIAFHGAQPPEFVAERLRRAAIFMQHSITGRDGDAEGAPSAIQEAMAAGAVVVATFHAGIPELVRDGVNGMLVAERDLDAYSDALLRVVGTPGLRERFAAAARDHGVAELDYRKLYRRVELALREAIEARAR